MALSNGFVKRPKDGMFTRFTGPVMDQICALVPDFTGLPEAQKFYKKLRSYKRFENLQIQARQTQPGIVYADRMPAELFFSGNPYRCTDQTHFGNVDLADGRKNPMEVLHIVAHYLQPSTGPWHGGEFGTIFLDLIERMFGKDIKRAAKDVMIKNKIKTSVRSAGTREKQSEAYYKRKVKKAPEGLVKILDDIRSLQRTFRDDEPEQEG